MGCNQVKVYNDSNTPLIHKLDWMKEIPDDTKFSQMNSRFMFFIWYMLCQNSDLVLS